MVLFLLALVAAVGKPFVFIVVSLLNPLLELCNSESDQE